MSFSATFEGAPMLLMTIRHLVELS